MDWLVFCSPDYKGYLDFVQLGMYFKGILSGSEDMREIDQWVPAFVACESLEVKQSLLETACQRLKMSEFWNECALLRLFHLNCFRALKKVKL